MFDAHRGRCLLVEDVAAMRALLRLVLQDTCFELIESESVRDARQILRASAKSPFDFAVLDLELPDGSGLDLMPEIGGNTRVIALTADETRETRLQCLAAGCDAVLSKSGQLSELKSLLLAPKAREPWAQATNPDFRESYIAYLAETRPELQEAFDQADFRAVRRIAHRLRGTAVHFGHPGISRAAKSVSDTLAKGCPDQVTAETSSLIAGIAEAIEAHNSGQRRHPNRVSPNLLSNESGPG